MKAAKQMQSILLFYYLPYRPGWRHLATHVITSLQLQPLKKLIYATSPHLGMEKDPDPPTHHLPPLFLSFPSLALSCINSRGGIKVTLSLWCTHIQTQWWVVL